MTAKKKKFIFLAVAAAVLVVLVIWIAWGNTALELNTYTVSSAKLPPSFDGYRIAHVSDLHNAEMGKDNEKLLTMLRDADPDNQHNKDDCHDNKEYELLFLCCHSTSYYLIKNTAIAQANTKTAHPRLKYAVLRLVFHCV